MASIDATDARLSTHEAVCAERYAAIATQFAGTNARLKRIEQLMIGAAASVLAGFGAIIILLIQLMTKA